MEKKTSYNINFAQALVAGGIAGTSVDVILYPLDTIKTRLQSKSGFYSSGGFRGIYSGLPSVIIGSAPGASAFFVTYEYFKKTLGDLIPDPKYSSLVHMTAASSGEVVACLIRTPTEVIKSRMQVKQYSSVPKAVKMIFQQEGFFGFYQGFTSLVFREVPFSCIQFPLYEYFKSLAANYTHRKYIEPWEAAICGSFAGGITAGVTTPLDVIKTRLMLSTKGQNIHNYSGITNTFYRILTQEGIKALFSGIGPRVLWISIGGYIFLGAYEKVKKTLYKHEIFA
ncbi:mitochondrial carrier [Gigaspora margarita]|uniref:Mitochondrial carrier n=2 Tax=Gigaspora margarita TaxID=4874 RepID=A0A8H3X9J8_GIGMA|nr:mitochondrial carrier [Gigaspora margarita]